MSLVKDKKMVVFPWWERERGKCVHGCAEGDEDCDLNKESDSVEVSKCAKMEYWEISVDGWAM